LEEVFLNLLSNAAKFATSGVPLRVRVGAEREGRGWRFSVRDNGIGVAPRHH
jgi:signal transduction histidine kinase